MGRRDAAGTAGWGGARRRIDTDRLDVELVCRARVGSHGPVRAIPTRAEGCVTVARSGPSSVRWSRPRLAQRSIMSRYVLEPVTFSDGSQVFEVGRGATIATLLPLTNTSSAPGYDTWDPSRWNRRRLADASSLPAVELVTVFGHGKHTCPAQPFSLAAMTAATTTLLSTFEWTPGSTTRPTPVPAQIGGVFTRWWSVPRQLSPSGALVGPASRCDRSR